MNRRWTIRIGLLVLLVVGAVAIFPASRLGMLGWLRGERFYRGRPICWWKSELRDCREIAIYAGDRVRYIYYRPPPFGDSEEWLFRFGSFFQPGTTPAVLKGDPAAIPILLDMLQDDDPIIRRMAAHGLGRVGTAGKDALPALLDALQDEEAGVRESVRIAIFQIDPETARQVNINFD